MLLPVSQLINALHSLKNSATASIQTLNRDLIPEHNSYLREVRCHSYARVVQLYCTFTHSTVPSVAAEYTTQLFCWRDIAVIGLAEPVVMSSFVAQCESEGPRPVRDQDESAGRAGQQVAAPTTARRTPQGSVGVEDKSCFLRQFFSQQTW